MKQFYLLLLSFTPCTAVWCQRFSVGDLVELTACTSNKFENYVSKKGYKAQGKGFSENSLTYAYYEQKEKEPGNEWHITKNDGEHLATISFQTTSATEYTRLSQQLKESGFIFTDKDTKNTKCKSLYQKANITIEPVSTQEEGKTVYGFLIQNKILPHAKDMIYAEDLLQVSSHEYLKAVYGAENVKEDVFYFSRTETNKCSVLFPNTNRQVIFIWNDEVNKKDISFLLIGGHLGAESLKTYNQQIELNAWQSAGGLQSGMSLKELEKLNGAPLYFHSWDSDQPGVLINKTNGKLNFNNISLVLDCFDCRRDSSKGDNNVLSSADVLGQNQRVYISTIIVLPNDQ